MSNLVFPSTLPGIDIKISRVAIYSTKIQTARSGRELRSSWWASPRYRYTAQFNFIRQTGFSQNTSVDEVALLSAFFAAHRGSWDSFLLPDPVEANLIANGNSEDSAPVGFGAAGVSSLLSRNGMKSRFVSAGLAAEAKYLQVAELAVTPGDQFYLETWCNSTINTSGWLDCTFYDAVGAQTNSSTTSAQPSTSWGLSSGTATAGGGAVTAKVFLATRSTDGSAARGTYHDDFVMRKMLASTDLPDGVNFLADGANQRFLRRVRFDGDELELERLVDKAWDGKTLSFLSVK